MKDSALARLAGVLISPGRTFQVIAARPGWVVALVVLIVVSAVGAYLVTERIDMADAMREQMAKQGQQLSDAELERMAGIQSKVGLGCAVAAPPIGYLIMALVFMVAFNIIGGEVKFPTSFSVSLHALMPAVVKSLLVIPVVLPRTSLDVETVQSGGLIASNLAFLAPEGTSLPLLTLLGSFDLFSLWTVALLAIGYRIAAGVSKNHAALTVVVVWLVYVLGKVGLAALGSAFGGGG